MGSEFEVFRGTGDAEAEVFELRRPPVELEIDHVKVDGKRVRFMVVGEELLIYPNMEDKPE